MRIAIAIFDDVTELDWAGPWDVLARWALDWPADGVETLTVADTLEPVRCHRGLRVLADTTWAELGEVDVLLYPGGPGADAQLGQERIRERIRSYAASSALLVSVCTGALVFADAGILDGRSATTHWEGLDRLSDLGHEIDVRADERFVDAGDVITAAGVSAGIDVALYLVARLGSHERALQIRRAMQYDPAPPV